MGGDRDRGEEYSRAVKKAYDESVQRGREATAANDSLGRAIELGVQYHLGEIAKSVEGEKPERPEVSTAEAENLRIIARNNGSELITNN